MQPMRRLNRPEHEPRSGQRGLTLIELLIVIAVLSILAGIVIFNVQAVKNKGQTTSCNTDVKTVQSGLDTYINDNGTTGLAAGGITDAEWSLIVPAYIHTKPTSCTTGFSLAAAGSGFTVSGS
jgi:prepilin-type N-terminal cleavage/methylation domain-containing protein